MSLAARVKLLIDSNNLSVTAAAKKCKIPQPRLNDIVLGRTTNPRSATVSRIAQGFGVTEGWLLTGEGDVSGMSEGGGIGHIEPGLAQAIEKEIRTKYQGKAFELSGEELMAVQMLRDLSDHDRQRVIHMLQMAWASGKVNK